jgi:hypothetical protein
MAIPTTGNISIKEAAGSTRSIDTAVTSTISGSLVDLSDASIQYTGSTRTSITADTDSSPYSMLEFSGYAHNSIGTWPTISLPAGDAGGALGPPGAAGTEIENWGFESYSNPNVNPDAWCRTYFERDDSNSRIKYRVKSGTSLALATDYWGYITYTGMAGATFHVKHNYTGSVTNVNNQWSGYDYPDEDPAITKDTYRELTVDGVSGYKEFLWIVKRTSTSNTATARISNANVQFTFKIVAGGVDYTVSSPTDSVFLEALKGEPL